MDSTLIFVSVIAIVVLITVFSCYGNSNLQMINPIRENFNACPLNPYRPRSIPYPDYKKEQEEIDGVKYGEDEDINFHLVNPLVPRVTKQPGENNSWRTFCRDKFMKGKVPEDKNFEGTQVRNYLDSIQYFSN